MSKQEATILALQTLYARLDTLRHMKVSDMLYPGQQTAFEQTIEEAYAALAKIETELDELGETLEYHHARLGEHSSKCQDAPKPVLFLLSPLRHYDKLSFRTTGSLAISCSAGS